MQVHLPRVRTLMALLALPLLANEASAQVTSRSLSTWNFQTWYRDPFGPCGQHSNLSNALSETFTP